LDAERSAVAAHEDAGEEQRGALGGEDPSSRRRFLRGLGGTAGASALAAVAAACGQQKPIGVTQRRAGEVSAFGPGDGGIVNFALFLEYVEGDFYDRAVSSGKIRDARQRDLLKQARENEAEHRNLLDRVADQVGRPIQKPKTNFDAVFGGGAKKIVSFAAKLENLMAAAYFGQLSLILDSAILTSVAGIHTVEARQAAGFSELAGRGFRGGGPLEGSIPNGPFARPMSMKDALKVVRPYYVGAIPNLRPPA
jgi:Ferritin-like domain